MCASFYRNFNRIRGKFLEPDRMTNFANQVVEASAQILTSVVSDYYGLLLFFLFFFVSGFVLCFFYKLTFPQLFDVSTPAIPVQELVFGNVGYFVHRIQLVSGFSSSEQHFAFGSFRFHVATDPLAS